MFEVVAGEPLSLSFEPAVRALCEDPRFIAAFDDAILNDDRLRIAREAVLHLLTGGYVLGLWQTMPTAPRDGSGFLAYGIHDHSPDDAARGVVAGDHLVFDRWRPAPLGQRFVFAKDGAPTWSEPLAWCAMAKPAARLLPPAAATEGGERG